MLPIGDLTEAQVIAGFTSFDVANAHCFREDERQKILGIIESGFGSFEAFNALVGTMFRARLKRRSSNKDLVTVHDAPHQLHRRLSFSSENGAHRLAVV